MLEIKEKSDIKGYEETVKNTDNFHVTEAIDKGKAIGFIAYSYQKDKTVIHDYDDGGDIVLCDGLVRSVMLKSVMKEIETVVFEISDGQKYDNLKKLRFVTGESKICENVSRFMNACEHCKKNK